MATEAPYISVVVPTYNRSNNVMQCLNSLLSQDCPGGIYEVIAIDDASTDETAKVLSRYEGKITIVLNGKNKGPAYTRNEGIRISKGTIIAFIDDDCVAMHDWISKIVNNFRGDDALVGVGGFNMPFPDAPIIEKAISLIEDFQEAKGRLNNAHQLARALATCNVAYKKEAIEKVGYFNVDLKRAEDLDLCMKLFNIGYKLTFDDEMIVYHKRPNTLKKLFLKYYSFGLEDVKLFRKFPTLFLKTGKMLPPLMIGFLLVSAGLAIYVSALPLILFVALGISYIYMTMRNIKYRFYKKANVILLAIISLVLKDTASGIGFLSGLLGFNGNRGKVLQNSHAR